MNELLLAAKHLLGLWHVDVVTNKTPEEIGAILSQRVQALGDAVERAEKQEAKPWTKPIPTDFKEWWETYALNKYGIGPAYHAWTAAQQAERERIKDLLGQSSDWFEDNQMAQANWLLEKIDGD